MTNILEKVYGTSSEQPAVPYQTYKSIFPGFSYKIFIAEVNAAIKHDWSMGDRFIYEFPLETDWAAQAPSPRSGDPIDIHNIPWMLDPDLNPKAPVQVQNPAIEIEEETDSPASSESGNSSDDNTNLNLGLSHDNVPLRQSVNDQQQPVDSQSEAVPVRPAAPNLDHDDLNGTPGSRSPNTPDLPASPKKVAAATSSFFGHFLEDLKVAFKILSIICIVGLIYLLIKNLSANPIPTSPDSSTSSGNGSASTPFSGTAHGDASGHEVSTDSLSISSGEQADLDSNSPPGSPTNFDNLLVDDSSSNGDPSNLPTGLGYPDGDGSSSIQISSDAPTSINDPDSDSSVSSGYYLDDDEDPIHPQRLNFDEDPDDSAPRPDIEDLSGHWENILKAYDATPDL